MQHSLRQSSSQTALWVKAQTRYQSGMTVEAANYLRGRGISKEGAQSAGLGVVNDPILGHERFVGMISIPYITRHVPVVGWKFRRMSGDGPKYDSPSGQKARLYGAHTLTNADTLLVCEGEFDAILAHQITGLPAVGVPGVSAWKAHYASVIDGYPRVLVLADNDASREDNPGRALARKICEQAPQASAIDLPPGDLTDFVMAGGSIHDLIKEDAA